METIQETGDKIKKSLKEQELAIIDFVDYWKKVLNLLSHSVDHSTKTTNNLLFIIKKQHEVLLDHSKILSRQIIYK